jgi:hypothetical protein
MGFDKLIFSLTDSIAFQVSKKQDSICKIFLQAYSFDMLMLGIGMTHPMPSAYQRWPSEFNSPGIFSCSRVRPSLHLIALTNPYSLHTVRCPNHVKVIESHGYIRSDVRTRVGIWPSRGTNYNTLVQTALLFESPPALLYSCNIRLESRIPNKLPRFTFTRFITINSKYPPRGAHLVATIVLEKPQRMAGIVAVFDFDKTIIDCDSDNWVVDELGATDLFTDLLPTMPWNSLMVCFCSRFNSLFYVLFVRVNACC